ncbi:Spy/CpxP family protein refolding chaperone [Halomonas alkalisoli]|uniref:Spy/CpxP family protein refolding chaperone n=1 Tax=Halomonas alkalisoli TaxID=2907158 RepID=UPI001F2D6321|nr:periplasmic heavy metal sensor [Halomonas alkalisoli]MCE9683092.1 periplasmic heavy metal sensor [Halomonas alkalisoli]
MKVVKLVATALVTLGMASPAMAQQSMQAPPQQGDQVDQLNQLLDLDDGQQQEIRGLLDDAQQRLQPMEQEAQALQARLGDHIDPNFDESAIRQDATRLGELTGELAAETTLLQARVEAVFTEEQRTQLEEVMAQQQQQMNQMQEQMRQQQAPPAQ